MSNISRTHSACRNNPAFLLALVLPFTEPAPRQQPTAALTEALSAALWPTSVSTIASYQNLLAPEA
jgi:hypothetical protein